MARLEKYTDDEICAALMRTNGLVYPAAKLLGCELSTIYSRAQKKSKIRELIDAQRRVIADTAKSKLLDAVENSEPWAISLAIRTFEPMANPQSGGDVATTVVVKYE